MTKLKVIYPMLASGGSNKDKWEDDKFWAEEKIDGSRYIMSIGEDGARFTSRQKSRKTGLPVEKTENIPHLAQVKYEGLSGTILDGEIQHKDFSKTISVMGSKPERAIQLQKEIGNIDYHVFDIVEHKGEDITKRPYKERRTLLEKVVGEMNNENVKLTEVVKENKRKFYHNIVENGGEGVILKHIDGIYEIGKRAKGWIKVKKYITDDVVIMGADLPTRYYDGKALIGESTWLYWEGTKGDRIQTEMTVEEGNKLGYLPVTRAWFNGWIGAIKFGKYKDGELIELGQTSGIEDEMKVLLSYGTNGIKKEYIGSVMEIGAMEQIKKSGAYRHPRFIRLRKDKNAEDCIWEVK